MAGIVIAYATGAGHTRKLAEAVAGGAGPLARLMDVESGADWETLHSADAIVFGSPTFMGTVSARFKSFMDATSDFWGRQLWRDKIAAGFTAGSSPSGDKANTLATLAVFAAQHGMIWVGQAEIGPPNAPERAGINTDGFWLGLGATSSRDKRQLIEAGELETARLFGIRIARAVRRWNGQAADA